MPDINGFNEIYNTDADETEIAGLISVAADIVCSSVLITNAEGLGEYRSKLYEKAVYAQTHFILINGGFDFLNSADSGGSFSLGSFSYGKSQNSSDGKSKSPSALCPLAEMYLEKAGLLYRGAVTV